MRAKNLTSGLKKRSVNAYIMAFKALTETCDFGTLKGDLILERIICGFRDNCVQKKLLQESGLTLSKYVDIFQSNMKPRLHVPTCEQEANAAKEKEVTKKLRAPKEYVFLLVVN